MIGAIEFTKAFYGGTIPISQLNVASIDIMRLVAIVKNDLRNEAGKADSEILDKGTLAILTAMRQHGATSPKVYYEREALAIRAFQAGMQKVRELSEAATEAAERLQFEQDRAKQREVRLPVITQVNEAFDSYKEEASKIPVPNPALSAWKSLVNNLDDFDLRGIGYFLISWRIPRENGIWDHPDVIAIMKSNSRLMNRKGPSKLTIGDKKW